MGSEQNLHSGQVVHDQFQIRRWHLINCSGTYHVNFNKCQLLPAAWNHDEIGNQILGQTNG